MKNMIDKTKIKKKNNCGRQGTEYFTGQKGEGKRETSQEAQKRGPRESS